MMYRPSGRQVFGLWFGLFLPPITIGALVLAFDYHWIAGGVTLLVLFAWVVSTSRTTCSRCWAYGTAGCGLPSLVAPLFGPRKSPGSVSLFRVRLQLCIEWAVAVLLNVSYLWLFPYAFPGVLLWTIGAWWVVVRPKRYHGLLHRLRRPAPPVRPGMISLPVITLTQAPHEIALDPGMGDGGHSTAV